MNLKLCTVCSFSVFLLLSCISEKDLLQKDHVVMRDMSAANINGNYSNRGDSTDASTYFYNYIIDYNSRMLRKQRDSTVTDSRSVINLEYDDAGLLTIRVFQKDSLIRETTVQVKKQGDVLLFKRHYFLVPIPFLFFFQDERRMALVSDANGNLRAYTGTSNMGWILMAAGQTYFDKQTYKRLK